MMRASSPSLRRGGRLLPVAAAALGLACGHGKVDRHIDRTPDVDFGASATILRPGQEPPPLGSWGTGGRMTSLGGARQNERRDIRTESGGRGGPFGVVGAPLAKVHEMATGDEKDPERRVGEPEAPARPPTREEIQQEHERRELERLREQLGGPPPPSAPVRTARAAPPVAAAAPSLAEERALLERRLAPATAATRRGEAEGPGAATGGGVADRAVDRNGDGRPDYWIYRSGERTTREVYDDTGDGRADRTVRYDPVDGRILEVEEDTDGDGAVDAWSHYEAGSLARRLADGNGDGRVDSWALYREGRLARLERDEDGDGFRDRVAFYRAGRLDREEVDADEDGLPELRIWYDENEAVRLREEDRNGDGEVDVRSHYEGGRLVRREVLDESALGSEIPDAPPSAARALANPGGGS